MTPVWYVKGRKHAFPYAEKHVSGPFDTVEPTYAELKRLEPFYPDAELSVAMHTRKARPTATPRTRAPADEEQRMAFDVKKVAGRRAGAQALLAHVERLGLTARMDDWDGEPDLEFITPSLRASVSILKSGFPMISWFGAAYPLAHAPDAWDSRNAVHYHKASTFPRDWEALFDALEIGLLASVDGSAFEL